LIEIRPASTVDPAALVEHVVAAWHDEAVVAHGERMYPARLPGFVALSGETIVGHVSYRADGRRCEVTSIEATPRQTGIGSMLMAAVVEAARDAAQRTLWLTTTNDNLDAIRFYQRRGFRLSVLRSGAVDRARETLKPEIPVVGSYGIPMRDELDLELELTGSAGAA
jgi:ribosomal protein S18 acetylase RimI-like enzyme